MAFRKRVDIFSFPSDTGLLLIFRHEENYMKKSFLFFAVFILFLITAPFNVFAQRGTTREQVTNIRFVSSLPRNSDWGRALDRLASEWARVTSNQVNVIMTHGSTMGETAMLSSLRSNSIQVAVFSSAGMYEICPSVMSLSIPFMIRNDAELDLVLADVKPVLESRVREEFVVIAWSKGGWIYVYSKEPVLVPNDLKRMALATNPELSDLNTVFRTMGFRMVEMNMATLPTRFASGAVNAFYLIPTLVTPFNLHRSLNMLYLPIAPVMGAIVINRVTWNQLSAANQREIVRVTQGIAAEFDAAMARTEANAITSMTRDGLTLNRPTQAQQDLWRSDLQSALPSLIGTVFDRDLYNRINAILERARR